MTSESAEKKSSRAAVPLLNAAALLRSMAQGAALVVTSLYLRELGWSAAAIGAALAGAGIVRAALSLFAAELNALLGAKRCLLAYEALTLCAALAVTAGTAPWLLASAVVAAGLGSGHSGAGGPAAPIERAWLGAYAKDTRHAKAIYGRNALCGYAGLGAGALLACLPALRFGAAEGPGSYRLVYALIALLSAGCMLCLFRLRGGKRKPRQAAAGGARRTPAFQEPANPGQKRRVGLTWAAVLAGLAAMFALSGWLERAGLRELSLALPVAVFLVPLAGAAIRLLREPRTERQPDVRARELQLLAASLSGVTATLTSTVTSYWFAARFGVSSGWIGLVMGASYLGAALLSRLASGSADRAASLRTIVGLQTAAIALLLALPWVRAFWLAAVLEIACTACNFGTRGSRTAVMMEERDKSRRGITAKLGMLVIRLSAVLWPGAFVQFVDEGQYALPFSLAAAVQAGAALLFAKAYRRDERGVAGEGSANEAAKDAANGTTSPAGR